MPFSQEQMRLLQSLHQRAQENLPVIPNNGNPQGANNMPAQPPSVAPVVPPSPWGQPSPGMDMIKQILASYNPVMPPGRVGFGNETMTPMPTPPMPGKVVNDPRMGFNDGAVRPGLPPLPRGTLRRQALSQELPPMPQRFGAFSRPGTLR